MTSPFEYFCSILIKKKVLSKKVVFADECIISQCLGVIIRNWLFLKILEFVVFMHKCSYSKKILLSRSKQKAVT